MYAHIYIHTERERARVCTSERTSEREIGIYTYICREREREREGERESMRASERERTKGRKEGR